MFAAYKIAKVPFLQLTMMDGSLLTTQSATIDTLVAKRINMTVLNF